MAIFRKENVIVKVWMFFVALVVMLCCFSIELTSSEVIKLGAMFSTENLTNYLNDRLQKINKNLTMSNRSLEYKLVNFSMSDNPIRAALDVCENILNEQVFAVFVSEDNSVTNDAVIGISYTCGVFGVPVVGIGVRDAIFSDKVGAI